MDTVTIGTWRARFLLGENVVNIEKVEYKNPPDPFVYFYVTYSTGHIGVFPGTDSDEWIEYIP